MMNPRERDTTAVRRYQFLWFIPVLNIWRHQKEGSRWGSRVVHIVLHKREGKREKENQPPVS